MEAGVDEWSARQANGLQSKNARGNVNARTPSADWFAPVELVAVVWRTINIQEEHPLRPAQPRNKRVSSKRALLSSLNAEYSHGDGMPDRFSKFLKIMKLLDSTSLSF
jgi:hypothetical protein